MLKNMIYIVLHGSIMRSITRFKLSTRIQFTHSSISVRYYQREKGKRKNCSLKNFQQSLLHLEVLNFRTSRTKSFILKTFQRDISIERKRKKKLKRVSQVIFGFYKTKKKKLSCLKYTSIKAPFIKRLQLLLVLLVVNL